MRYEKYIIGKLFTSQNGDTDIKKDNITGRGVPVITSGVDKNGILGNTDLKARIIKANTITIDMFGNAFFRPFEYKMVTHARVFSMELIEKEMNEAIGLYFVTQFHWFPKTYNYSNMCSYSKIKDLIITLPSLDQLDKNSPYSDEGFIPDFDYMQERINKLEQEHIEELEQYLIATDCNDYELTDEDIKNLSISLVSGITKNEIIKMLLRFCKEFKVSRNNNEIGLFDCFRGTRLTKSNRKEGDVPLLTAGVGLGEGVAQKIQETKDLILYSNDITIDMFGLCFYHDYDHYGDDNIHFLVNNDINEKSKIFITQILEKQLKGQFSYGRQFRMNYLEKMFISLPVQTDDNNKPIIDTDCKYHPDGYIPDWDFMEKYIRAIEKIVIADVVQYKDVIISKTKEVTA